MCALQVEGVNESDSFISALTSGRVRFNGATYYGQFIFFLTFLEW